MKRRMIGAVGAPRNEPAGAEIGYKLHPDFWGRGYMSEALRLFIGLYWGPGSASSLFVVHRDLWNHSLNLRSMLGK